MQPTRNQWAARTMGGVGGCRRARSNRRRARDRRQGGAPVTGATVVTTTISQVTTRSQLAPKSAAAVTLTTRRFGRSPRTATLIGTFCHHRHHATAVATGTEGSYRRQVVDTGCAGDHQQHVYPTLRRQAVHHPERRRLRRGALHSGQQVEHGLGVRSHPSSLY